MMKALLLVFISVAFLACDDSHSPNDIGYFKLNDFHANYIFDFDNTKLALKTINNFALNGVEKQKHFVDSLKKAGYLPPSTYEESLVKSNLPTVASNIILYTPPLKSFDPVDEKDIVAEYIVGEESFKVEHIKIGERYATETISIEKTLTGNKCTLKLSTATLNLEVLYQILKKTEILAYQKQHLDFKYTVSNNNNIKLLEVIYTDNGKHIALNYL